MMRGSCIESQVHSGKLSAVVEGYQMHCRCASAGVHLHLDTAAELSRFLCF